MAEQSLESIKQWLIDILTPPKKRTEDINLDEEYEFQFPQILTEPETFGTGTPPSEPPSLDLIPEIVGEQVPADQSDEDLKRALETMSADMAQAQQSGRVSDTERDFQHLMPQPGDQAAEKWSKMAAADVSGMGQALFGGAQSAEQDASRWGAVDKLDKEAMFKILFGDPVGPSTGPERKEAQVDASQWQSARPSDKDLSFLKQKVLTMLDDKQKLEEFWKYLPK